MFGIDDTLDEIRERLITLRDELEDLIPDTPAFMEIEFEIEELEEMEENILENALEGDLTLDEVLESARVTGDPEDWSKVREIYEGGIIDLSEMSSEAQEYILSNR